MTDYNKPYYINRYCNIHENGLIYEKYDIIRYMNLDTMQDTILYKGGYYEYA
ncbi:MAG: hypothetical protein K2G36_06125 [Ruminococcus sp.]|nr:hypothetical protein [Ruminococcus sp.]